MNFWAGKLRALQITVRDAGAADQELALLPGGDRRKIRRDDPAGIIRDGLPDGDRLAGLTSSTVATTVASVGP